MLFHVGVVGHTSRTEQALALADQAGGYLALDDGTLGCTANHLRVLEHLATLGSQYSVILEDDAQPVEGFTDQLAAALESAPRVVVEIEEYRTFGSDDPIKTVEYTAPAPIVSFYLGTGYPRYWQKGIGKAITAADQADAPWITSEHLLHAVAYAIRTDLVPDLLANRQQLPIDDMITAWARTNAHPVAYTHPSICEHADGPTVITARSERQHPRRAHRTGTRTTWHGPTTTLEY